MWAAPGRGGYDVTVLALPWNATVTTSLRPLRRNWPELAWSKYGRLGRFLSAEAARPGDHWTVRFAQPHRLVRVTVHTGNERYPYLVAPPGSELRVLSVPESGGDPEVHSVPVIGGTASLALGDHGGALVAQVQLLVGGTGDRAPTCLLVESVDMEEPG